jgi:MFS transporter, OPA family, sugar phosphate sensor protein UhpC
MDNFTPIADLKKQTRYWHWRVFLSIYFGYAFFYLTRKSFIFSMPFLINDLGMTKISLGILGTIFSICYGISKFASGIISDKSSPRFFMGSGLILTGILNICFGSATSILFFAIFWAMNGLFQASGYPSSIRLLTHWYPTKERGTWWGAWQTALSAGGLIAYIIVTWTAMSFGWRYGMWIPGCMAIVMGGFVIFGLRDEPQKVGLPPADAEFTTANIKEEKKESVADLLKNYILGNKYLWILSFAYFFIYIVRTALYDWSLLYLIEERGMSNITAGFCVTCIEIGAILGAFVTGWTSDYFFQGKRTPANIVFTSLIVVFVVAFWMTPASSVAVDAIFLGCIGFLMSGPLILTGMAVVESTNKKAAGTAIGIASGIFAYGGAALAGYPIGYITENFGWSGYFMALISCSLLTLVFLVPALSPKSVYTERTQLETN